MSNWWADRLSGKEITPKEEPSVRVGSTPPIRFTPTQAPPETPAVPPTPQEQYMATQTMTDPEANPSGQMSMGEAIRMWKGGEAHRKEGNLVCPECGSKNMFTRVARGTGTSINGANPAPRCFECGWNGLFDQGIEANWIA